VRAQARQLVAAGWALQLVAAGRAVLQVRRWAVPAGLAERLRAREARARALAAADAAAPAARALAAADVAAPAAREALVAEDAAAAADVAAALRWRAVAQAA